VALPLYLLHQALRPLHLLFDRLVEPLVRSIAGETADKGEPVSSEAILRMAERVREGQPQGSALAIMGSVADAADTNVGEIMVPRTEVAAFPIDTPPAELLDRLLEGRYTRLPIYEGSIDHVLGIVHLKDLIVHVNEEAAHVRPILKPVLRVPPRKRILPLLSDMQRSFSHMAIVKDEFGVTEGLVTQEDILEELVGEIRDEFDRDELLEIQALDAETFQALARVKVQDFNRETGWEVPAEPGDTLGGLVFNALGRAPERADAVALEGYRLVVAGLSGARITQVRVERVPAQSEEQDA
jgi:CBS domain containing-hemolysin-like protein